LQRGREQMIGAAGERDPWQRFAPTSDLLLIAR
jgi:hypothetical protein